MLQFLDHNLLRVIIQAITSDNNFMIVNDDDSGTL